MRGMLVDDHLPVGRLADRLHSLPRERAWFAILLSVTALALANAHFPRIGLAPFYIPIVCAACWALGSRAGYLVAVVAAVLAVVGVALTASHGELSALLALDLNRGDALMMLAVLIYGGYTVALRFKPKLHWRSTIFVLALSALVVSVPLAGIEWAMGHTQLPDTSGMTAALYTAIFPSLLAQVLYIRGIELIGPNRANLFVNLVPIFGAILAVLIIGEELHAYHVAALTFVLGGIMLAERGAARARKASEA